VSRRDRRREETDRRSREGAVLGLHRGNLRTALVAGGCLVGRPDALSVAAGGVLVAAGLALHLASKGALRQNRELATAGPYRWTRHPFYLANLVIDVGLGVAIAQPLLLAAYLPVWMHVYGATMRREEALLRSLFGDAYGRYAARVPRLLPRRRPAPRDPGDPGFSWRNPNLVSGAEFARIAGVLATLPLLWLVARARALLLDPAAPDSLVLAHEAAALALLASLKVLQHGLAQRFKRGRTVLPAVIRTAPVLAASLAGLALALLEVEFLESDPTLFALALPALGLLLAGLALGPRHPALPPLGLGAACLASALAVGLPFLGTAWFALLALDADLVARGRPKGRRRRRDPGPPTLAWLGAALLVIVGIAEVGAEARWVQGSFGSAPVQASDRS